MRVRVESERESERESKVSIHRESTVPQRACLYQRRGGESSDWWTSPIIDTPEYAGPTGKLSMKDAGGRLASMR